MSGSPRLFSGEQLAAALDALGVRAVHSTDPARPVRQEFLLAALLALVETALVHDAAAAAGEAHAGDGRGWALDLMARHGVLGELGADRARAVLLRDRLNRTVDEIRTVAPGGEPTLPIAGVTGPAVLAAANLATLLHTVPTPGVVVTAVTTAAANLRMAAAALDELQAALRHDGLDV